MLFCGADRQYFLTGQNSTSFCGAPRTKLHSGLRSRDQQCFEEQILEPSRHFQLFGLAELWKSDVGLVALS